MKSHITIWIFIFTVLVGCTQLRTPDLEKWAGQFVYEEEPEQALAGYFMVMTWELSLDSISDNELHGILKINGQQTYDEFSVKGTLKDSKLVIKLDSVINGFTEVSSGNELFRLVYSNNSTLTTEWSGLQPLLTEGAINACGNCFKKRK